MNPLCEKLQDALAAQGREAATAHLRDCADCQRFLEALQEIDATLGELPSHDAPPQLVDRLMAAQRERGGQQRRPTAVVDRESDPSERRHPERSQRVQRLDYAGGVDADGHILEDPELWERYLEPQWRDRAMRLRRDAHGLEYLEIDGAPSKVVRGGMLGMLGGMGRNIGEVLPSPDHTYVAGASFGALDAGERVQRLDKENLDAAFLYPTLGVLWEAECLDPQLAQAYTRAYNRWIVDFCADSDGRLIPIAHLSLSDPAAAAQELERAVRAGARGGWVAPFTMSKKPHGHPDHDRLFAAAQDLDVPLAIHPTFEPRWATPGRFEFRHGAHFFLNVTSADAVRHAFTSFFQFAVFDRFPRLKLVLLESGAGWIGYWLDRMEGYASSLLGLAVPLKEKPSTYFRRQCWISCDPDERTIPALMDLYGEDRFFWASDFPHPDHTGDYIEELQELAGKLSPQARPKLLGENVRRCYGV
jgi:predicted TIM-barrel fold metal-dependent hydrolase